MANAEIPRPDDEPKEIDNSSHEESKRELRDNLSIDDSALPEFGEVSAFTEALGHLQASRTLLLQTLSECYVTPIAATQLIPQVEEHANVYVNNYKHMIDVAIGQADNDDSLLNEATAITSIELDECTKVFSLLSNVASQDSEDLKGDIRLFIEREIAEHASSDDDKDSSLLSMCIAEVFKDKVVDDINTVIHNLPDTSAEQLRIAKRARLIYLLGESARQAVTVTLSVAAGILIARKIGKK